MKLRARIIINTHNSEGLMIMVNSRPPTINSLDLICFISQNALAVTKPDNIGRKVAYYKTEGS